MMDIFKEKGLQKILLPRENIKPLMLLQYIGNGKVEIIGNVSELFLPDTSPLPSIIKDEKVAEWDGNSTIETDVTSSLSFLQGIWNRLGKADLTAAYKNDDSVIFSFKNLVKDSIDSEIRLDTYLRTSVLNNKVLEGYRNRLNNGDLYVLTYALKSDNFEVKIIDKSSGNVKLDANIKQILETNIGAGKLSDVSQSLKSNGQKIVFAVRIKKIYYDQGNWFNKPSFELKDPSKITVLGKENFSTTDLITEDGLIDII